MPERSYILSVMEMRISSKEAEANKLPLAAASIAACVLVTVFSQGCREGVYDGLELCGRVLIPSLFPFMAVTGLCVRSGFCRPAGRAVNKICRALFGLPGEAAPVLTLSLFGGYPVGAKGIVRLRDDGALTGSEAEKASLFAVCSGMGFMLNFIGGTLYGNLRIGIIMFLAQAAAVILLGIIVNLTDKNKGTESKPIKMKYSPPPMSAALVESVRDACEAMLTTCGQVLAFSAVLGSLKALPMNEGISLALKTALEVCAAVRSLSEELSPEFVAFAAGFGGLCVHFQVFSLLRDIRVPKLIFFGCRIVQGLLAAALTWLGLRLVPGEQAVFSVSEAHSAGVYGGSCISAAALAVTAICFLLSLGSLRRYDGRKKPRR